MKTNLVLLLLLFPLLVFSQFNSSIDFVGGVDYTYRTLKTDSEEIIIKDIISWRVEETGKLNWRLGINYNKRLAKRIFIKTGIQFASVGYKSQKVEGLIYASDLNYGTGIVPGGTTLPREIQFIYNYLFLELPVMLRYEFNEKKISPFVEAGVSPHLFVTRRTRTLTDVGNSGSYTRTVSANFNHLQFVGTFSFGFQYQLDPRWQLYGKPTFRYHFTKMVNAPIVENLYSYGLEFGLRKSLK